MNCSNCHKQIPDDSEFCIFCGEKIDYLPNQNVSTHKQKLNQINKIKKSKTNNKKNFITIILLSIFISFSAIAIIFLSVFLSININKIKDNEKLISDLKWENTNLNSKFETLNSDFKNLDYKYNTLYNDYKNLENKYDYEISKNNNQNINNTTSENIFLNSVSNTLNEYNLAINHMNTYHKNPWIFNDPEEVALEETFLTKLYELLNQLKNINYPSSFSNERNNLVNIFEQMCNYKEQQIDYCKKDDFNNNKIMETKFEEAVNNLFNYYNLLL